MNATAVRMIGMLIYCWVNPGSFLHDVALKTGTLLNPPAAPAAPVPGAPVVVDRASLLREASLALKPADRAAIAAMAPVFARTVLALEEIYGQAGVDVTEGIRVANLMINYEI
jgi:CHASE2 domain-containing sensor protein